MAVADLPSPAVTLITGAASGIGRELAIQLAQHNAFVVLADLNDIGLMQTESMLQSGVSESHVLDVADAAAVQRLVDDVVMRHGRIDAIYNVAGIAILAEFGEMNSALWRKILDVNLLGVINGCQAAYPHMQRQRSGRIVNIASLAGLLPAPSLGAYCTTKAAVVMLSRVMRAEAQTLGISVNVVCPAFVDSRIYENAIAPGFSGGAMRNMVPLPIMDTGKAVRMMLRGVARDQAVIVLPGYAKVLWLLARWFPGILSFTGRDAIRRYREAKAAVR